MIALLLGIAFASPDYYLIGCLRASSTGDIIVCMKWKQYRATKDVSDHSKFIMGCRSQLLYENKSIEEIINRCDLLARKEGFK